MRFLVKLVILVAIVFGFMTVYGLFDFHYGFANGLGEINELEILASDNVKYLVINDDTMYVTLVYNNRLYAGLLTSSDAGYNCRGTTAKRKQRSIAIICLGYCVWIRIHSYFVLSKNKEEGIKVYSYNPIVIIRNNKIINPFYGLNA